MPEPSTRRIVYVSDAASPLTEDTVNAILAQSRRNNGIDGVSGFLWSDGSRFAQFLEGPPDSVGAVIERIAGDSRHHAMRVISDDLVDAKLFADWSMAYVGADRLPGLFAAQFARLRGRNEPSIDHFLDHIGEAQER